jgi:CBS domain-containing protein
VWEHYDVNKDGILNKSELIVLARDLVDRVVSMCRDNMKVQMPKSSDADIDKLIRKELPHILPAKTMEESRKVMAEHIYRELDIDKDELRSQSRLPLVAVQSACDGSDG